MAFTKAVFVTVLALAVAVALYTTDVTFNGHQQQLYTASSTTADPSTQNPTIIDHHHIVDENPASAGEKHMTSVDDESDSESEKKLPAKRVSRFLAAGGQGGENSNSYKNLNAASHCKFDAKKCTYGVYKEAGLTDCCHNKCVDLNHDRKNCGKCGKKCKYTQACCGGKCVYLAYSISNCGSCYHKCRATSPLKKPLCLYGMCDYA